MQVNLQGQVALVTGGANGIGRAIATAISANGASVAIVDREIDAARATAAELSQSGARVEAWQADVGEKDQVETVWCITPAAARCMAANLSTSFTTTTGKACSSRL